MNIPCPRGPIYKSLDLKSLDYGDHVTSINSVTAIVHEDTVTTVLLTVVRYYLLIYTSK